MAAVDLRPMTLGEVLDRTFKLYKSNFWLFIGITALPFSFLLLIQVAVTAFGSMNPGAPRTPSASTGLSPSIFAGAMTGAALVIIFYLLSIGAAHAATVFAVSDLYLARPASVRGSFARVGWKVFRVLFVFFLIGLVAGGGFFMVFILGAALKAPAIIGLGILALVFPVILLVCRTAVAVPTAMLEDLGAVRSLERSMQLTKGHAMQIFLIFLLVVAMTYMAVVIFEMPVFILLIASTMAHKQPSLAVLILQQFAAFVPQVLIGPIGTIAFSLMYYNLRVRKEAFDIQHLMASLGNSPSPSAPSAA
jgi:glycerophosphoryl diester phosphodiesterase family protein